MRVEGTRWGQAGELPVATNCTGELTVAPLFGAATTTPAYAELAKVAPRHTSRQYFLMLMQHFSSLLIDEVTQEQRLKRSLRNVAVLSQHKSLHRTLEST